MLRGTRVWVCVCVCVCVCAFVCEYKCMCVCVCPHVPCSAYELSLSLSVSVYAYVCLCVWKYACVFVCVNGVCFQKRAREKDVSKHNRPCTGRIHRNNSRGPPTILSTHRFKSCEGDLVKTVNAATTLIEEIEEMARECLPVNGEGEEEGDGKGKGEGGERKAESNASIGRGEREVRGPLLTEAGREARVDVFEFCLRFYHMRFVQEISMFLLDANFQNSSAQVRK